MDRERLDSLIRDVKSRKGSFIPGFKSVWRDLALGRADVKGRSLLQVRAGILYELANAAPIAIYPGWTLAGEHLLPSGGWACFAQGAGRGFENLEAEMESIGFLGEARKASEAFSRYNARLSASAPGEASPDSLRGSGSWGEQGSAQVFVAAGWKENHSIRDYAKLLRVGFKGLQEEIEAELASRALSEPDYPERESFLLAARLVCLAGARLGERYAELAGRLASESSDPAERARLSRMAELCGRVPARGARTFEEAVQSLWFGHMIACAEDGINANSLGRLDRILEPFRQASTPSREDAVELMAELAAKLYLDYDVQAISVGGCDAQGACAVNETSWAILEATALFGEIRDLSVRFDSKTPAPFLKACAKLALRGGGIPFFFNDEAFVPALSKRGVKLEDARDYAPIGCVELTIPGKANPHAVSGWFNLLKCLELALNGGVDPATGIQLGPECGTLEGYASFEELMAAFQRQVRFFAERMVVNCRRGEAAQREFGPLPAWSLLTDDCLKRARDVTNGGAVYNYHSVCLMGVPDSADALAALKLLVYERRSISPGVLAKALKAGFEGFEELRKRLLNEAPKYGNGDETVDGLAGCLSSRFIELMDSFSSPGSSFFVHLFTFRLNVDFGRKVGAMPDGRRPGEPLAYSLSPHQGRDSKGVTSLLRSLARQPHSEAAGGSAAIVDLHPSVLERRDGEALLLSLLESALKLGVGQLQWNVVSAERLELAKADPETYGGIPVRVAGYSQAFKLIEPSLQDHIIARTKHGGL